MKVVRRISWGPVPLAARQLFPQALSVWTHSLDGQDVLM